MAGLWTRLFGGGGAAEPIARVESPREYLERIRAAPKSRMETLVEMRVAEETARYEREGLPYDRDAIAARAAWLTLQDLNEPEPELGSGRTYPVALVGEQHYQAAIGQLREGDPVMVWHEPGNPYDDRALAVTDAAGRTVGYLPRDSFVHDACLDEEKGCRARVLTLEGDRRGEGFTHVRVEVELRGAPIGVRAFASR